MKLSQKSFLVKYWPILSYFLISVMFLSPILIQKGVPFKYDWNWPIFSMAEFWHNIFDPNSFGLFSVAGKLLYSILGGFSLFGLSPSISIKIFLLLIHALAGFGFYRLLVNRGVSKTVAFLSGLAYSFSAYIFIRTIVGFVTSLVAYAILPFFVDRFSNLKNRSFWSFLLDGFFLTLIFTQIQAGAMVLIFILIWFLLPEEKINYILKLKRIFLLFVSTLIINIPWTLYYLFFSNSGQVPNGEEVTTLNFIASLPHSLLRTLMLSDQHITYKFFDYYSKIPPVAFGFLLIYLIAFLAFRNQKNRKLLFAVTLPTVLFLPFSIGPTSIFKAFYTFFFNHFPTLALFRETYHFEFWISFTLIFSFAFGLQELYKLAEKFRFSLFIKIVASSLIILIIAQYFTFNFFGRFYLQEIPTEYSQLNDYLKSSNICKKIYYPPSLGFIYFDTDKSKENANSDLIAKSVGVDYISDAASVLNISSDEMFTRNYLTSHFLDSADDGEFAKILAESGADCMIIRNDLRTNYYLDAKINLETDAEIRQKWIENNDLIALAKSKKNLALEKQFGEDIFIFKISGAGEDYQNQKIESLSDGEKLPLTTWATEFNYYKDGWVRGRYAFWRKEIFADLKQDFLYTVKDGAVLTGEVEKDLSGDLVVRYLDGGSSGSFELSAGDFQYTISKSSAEEKFVVKNFGHIDLKAGDQIKITNTFGENAIADVVIK